jgi:hypothetical protein
MTKLTMTIPENTILEVCNPEGVTILTEDIITLDQELAASQTGIPQEELMRDRSEWCERYAAALSARATGPITPFQAYLIAVRVNKVMKEILGN